jgi:8-oxo-dGTP diphosphatase
MKVKELLMSRENSLQTNILLITAAALVDPSGRVLVQKRRQDRDMGGLWEFPGGKVEPGESPEMAIVRELNEELGIAVEPDDLKPAGFASAPLGDRHLLLLLYIGRHWVGKPEALDADALQWIAPAALHSLAMPPADIPLIAVLEALT